MTSLWLRDIKLLMTNTTTEMLNEIKHLPVNWVDGMKINKNHFVQTENAFNSRLLDVNAQFLTSFNYGLLSPSFNSGSALDFKATLDKDNLLRVTLLRCRAITPGGARIEVLPRPADLTDVKNLSAEFNLTHFSDQQVYIVVSVNPFARIAAGIPSPEENPPRFPFAGPAYSLNIMSREEIGIESGAYHLCIGKLTTKSSGFELQDNFIPPCTRLSCHPELIDIHHDLMLFLVNMEKYCCEIIQKIYSKNQSNELAISVLYLSEQLLSFINSNSILFRWTYLEQAPIYLIELFSRLAKIIKNVTDVKAGAGTEQMLSYFKDWIMEVNQGEFDSILMELINVRYNHNDIDGSIEKVQNFTLVIDGIFKKLSRLDYIGEKKKAEIIVTARAAEESPGSKKRSFLLD